MNEDDLRDALRTTITRHPEPPPMRSADAVVAGRAAARRRNLLAVTGSAAAILGVTLAVVPGRGDVSGGTPIEVAAPAASVSPVPTGVPPLPVPTGVPSLPTGVPSDGKTEPSWPAEASGDATADSGANYEKGVALLAELLAVVPAGYTVPEGSGPHQAEFRGHQAALGEGGRWELLATAALRKGDGTGQLLVEVHPAGNGLPADVCAVATAFWGRGGNCEPVAVGGGTAGVVRQDAGTVRAAFRHPDGTVVYVMESTAFTEGLAPLPKLPLTASELAGLAADERFLP